MWPSSRNRRRFRGGFTLVEALVSMTILVIVMVFSMSLLFSMRSFASRQQYFTEPRQTARRSMDYLAYHVTGAADLNTKKNNPLALVTWYLKKNVQTQATYNNLTGAETGNATIGAGGLYTKFGDVGTDILTVAVPTNPMAVPVATWNGGQHAANLYVDFRAGCTVSDAYNLQLFQQVTGATGSGNQMTGGLMVLVDVNGNYVFYQITGYQGSNCSNAVGPFDPSNPLDVIHVVNNPGGSGFIDPPGGQPGLTRPITLSGGVQFMTFRVRTPLDGTGTPTGPPNLEQRIGLFDPTTDNPGTAFAPIGEGVEDLQVAYLYASSPGGGKLIFNDGTTPIPVTVVGAPPTMGVPPQAGSKDPQTPYDITNVIGLRITTTGRSGELPLVALGQKSKTGPGATHFRPLAEDHLKGADDVPTSTAGGLGLFDHYRMTSTLMLRNRMLGN